jgi:hypothetical protein
LNDFHAFVVSFIDNCGKNRINDCPIIHAYIANGYGKIGVEDDIIVDDLDLFVMLLSELPPSSPSRKQMTSIINQPKYNVIHKSNNSERTFQNSRIDSRAILFVVAVIGLVAE